MGVRPGRSVGVHTRFKAYGYMRTSAICNERWVLISFGDICGPTCHYHCICGYTLTIPPPHTLPYYPRINLPRVLLWLGLPPSIIMGAQRHNLRLARGSAKSVCLSADRYLHHVEDHWGGTPSLGARRQNL